MLSHTALARADIWLVVNADNPLRSLSAQDAASLYLGRKRYFPGGEYALVFDQPRDSPLRDRFFRQVARMSLAQVHTYWSRLMFSGLAMPPQAMPDEQSVFDVVARNPGALGYVGSRPASARVRVVLHLKE